MFKWIYLVVISFMIYSCSGGIGKKAGDIPSSRLVPGTYGYDRSFLKKQLDIVELTDKESRVLLIPQYQGRVMTSTCSGDSGLSFGWVNYKLIQSGEVKEHMNAYGGEERLWLGPEGGQFAVFFKEKVPFQFEHWFTPKELDTAAFEIIDQSSNSVAFSKNFQLINRSGSIFLLGIDRKVRILNKQETEDRLGAKLGNDIKSVAYESRNILTNRGRNDWKKETGLLSIWMLGMLKPSPTAIIALPVKEGDEEKLGPVVNDKYFGAIPPNRLRVNKHAAFLKADGKNRGKLGIPPTRVRRFIGSYDDANHLLTLLELEVPEGAMDYVNSAWEEQKNPYSGDVFNAYNDGPLEDGSQLGPFYELESSSPAAELAAGKSLHHKQVTYHITGSAKTLNEIARYTLGLTIDEIKNAFRN